MFCATKCAFRLLILFLLSASLVAAQQPYPKPQIASAEGQPAPDFTLKDQDGNDVTLSKLRGSRVLIIFYRGHW